MHRLSAAVTLSLLLLHSAGAQEKSAREKANLLGPVRSVRSITIDYKDATQKVSLGVQQGESVTYDEKGNEIERITNLLGLVSKEVRTYDTNGNLTHSVSSDSTEVNERRVYTYENGKLVRIVSHDADGKVNLTETNSYGKDGLLLETKYVTGKGPFGKTVYKYDAQGNLVEVAFYHSNGARTIAPVGPCVGAHRLTYTYDEQRKPTKIVFYEPDGKVRETWQYSYDAKGLETTHTLEYYSAKQTSSYVYQYDSHGNWIRKTTTTDLGAKDFPEASKVTSVTAREILYY